VSIPADRQGAGVDRACAGSCARTALRDAARPFGSAHDRRWTFLLAALWGLIVPSAILPAAAQEPVSIGLIVPGGGPLAAVGAAVRAGAERAIRRANDEGGFQGRPFRLLVVTQEGLWGRGLARVVSLSFDQPVVGVIGGLDGRGGHLIQQVVTKARIPFITPWASDFTLSYPAPVLFPRVLTGQAREREAGDSTTAAAHEPAVALPAAFGGDAVRAFVAAVRSAGTDPWRVRDALAVQAVQGDTGEVAFDASGRRSGVVELTGQPTR
jgi:ABC-type branched-subunit amino acid transport system substrate-binding protein